MDGLGVQKGIMLVSPAAYEYQNLILGFNKETSVVSGRDLPLMDTRRISIFTTFQQFQNSQGQILPASDSRHFLYKIKTQKSQKTRIFYGQADGGRGDQPLRSASSAATVDFYDMCGLYGVQLRRVFK